VLYLDIARLTARGLTRDRLVDRALVVGQEVSQGLADGPHGLVDAPGEDAHLAVPGRVATRNNAQATHAASSCLVVP